MKFRRLFKKAAATLMAAVTALSILPATTAFAAGDIGTISFSHTYDSSGNAMRYNSSATFDGHTAGGTGNYKYRMFVDGENAFCIQPGVPLKTGNTLKQASSDTWNALSANQKKAVGLALLYGYQGNRSNLTGSVDEVDRIYDSYTKLAAKAEMMKINRLPKAKRKAAMMRKLQDIVLHNKDLPFYKIEGEPSEPIIPATDIIEEEFKDSIAEIAQSGWTIPLTIDIERLDELRACSSNHTDIDAFFSTFYSDDELDDLYDTIYNSIDNLGQKKRFEECYIIFKQGLYSSCLTTLTTILEGAISTFGDDPKDVRIMRICNFHAEEERNNGNKIKSLCWQSMYEYTKLLFEKSDFSKAEPDEANRHWLVHGRTSQIGDKLDCIRLINALATLSNLK